MPYGTVIVGDGDGEPIEIDLPVTDRLSRFTPIGWSFDEPHVTIFHSDGRVSVFGVIPFKSAKEGDS